MSCGFFLERLPNVIARARNNSDQYCQPHAELDIPPLGGFMTHNCHLNAVRTLLGPSDVRLSWDLQILIPFSCRSPANILNIRVSQNAHVGLRHS